jgi:uncharacterized protein (DUF433 family)
VDHRPASPEEADPEAVPALLEPATMNLLPAIRIHHPHIAVDHTGTPIIEGTRVPVRRIWAWHRKGVTVETLLRRYPSLKPSQVITALAFAYDNQDLIAADLAREEELLGVAK